MPSLTVSILNIWYLHIFKMHTFTYVYVLEKQVESTPKTKWAVSTSFCSSAPWIKIRLLVHWIRNYSTSCKFWFSISVCTLLHSLKTPSLSFCSLYLHVPKKDHLGILKYSWWSMATIFSSEPPLHPINIQILINKLFLAWRED